MYYNNPTKRSFVLMEIKNSIKIKKGYSHSGNYILTLQTQSVCIDENKKFD